MKQHVSKAAKVSLCRMCHGTGVVEKERNGVLRVFKKWTATGASPLPETCVCPQCEGSGRVTVSAETELEIRPYKPKVR